MHTPPKVAVDFGLVSNAARAGPAGDLRRFADEVFPRYPRRVRVARRYPQRRAEGGGRRRPHRAIRGSPSHA